MADDFDNTDEIQNLSDDELQQLVNDQLREQPMIDGDPIEVHVQSGKVTVAGTVGTEEELRILDHVLTDTIGLAEIQNDVVIDGLHRAESPEAIDEHLADEEQHAGLMIGDRSSQFSAESEHLADMPQIDSLDDPGGTHDVGKAIEEGEPWIPPEGPTPEGLSGLENEGTFGHDTTH
ncbi:MAG TPA: BON domain-containing protein [Gemmatimonadaceae bacterium]|nr:BON domain-containing protein [Gemmatimonadaceae bacterium]